MMPRRLWSTSTRAYPSDTHLSGSHLPAEARARAKASRSRSGLCTRRDRSRPEGRSAVTRIMTLVDNLLLDPPSYRGGSSINSIGSRQTCGRLNG